MVVGAVPGALTRYYISVWFLAKFGAKFPYATMGINLTGCLLMGFFFSLSHKIVGYPHEVDLIIRTGFLGSYTTFSTYAYDTLLLWREQPKNINLVLLYWLGSSFLGVILIYCGEYLAEEVVLTFVSTKTISLE